MAAELSRKKFIECASEIIASDGIHGLSIRKIAKSMDCYTGNIYYYFENLDELIAYANMEYYADYLADVSILHAREGYSAEAYEKSWLIYMDHALRNPDIFMKLIYGPYAGKIGAIAVDYYEMFPERKKQLNSDIVRILFEKTLKTLDDHLDLRFCIENGTFTKERAELLGFVLSNFSRGVIYEFNSNEQSLEHMKERFAEGLHEIFRAFAD